MLLASVVSREMAVCLTTMMQWWLFLLQQVLHLCTSKHILPGTGHVPPLRVAYTVASSPLLLKMWSTNLQQQHGLGAAFRNSDSQVLSQTY